MKHFFIGAAVTAVVMLTLVVIMINIITIPEYIVVHRAMCT